jgi:hypothetical protein
MFNTFNNQSIRKLVVAFGSLFDEIYIIRKNETTDIEQNSSISDNIKTQINLPYMSFDISAMGYDNTRKRNKLRVSSAVVEGETLDDAVTYKTFSETPILLNMNLYFYVRNLDEGYQIIEQIVSYFNPEFNMRLNFNEIFKNINVSVSLRDIKIVDDHEGTFNSKRTIAGNISFQVFSYLFGEIKSGSPSQSFNLTQDSDPDPVTYAALLNAQGSNIVINSSYNNQFYTLTGTTDTTFISNFTWEENNVTELQTTIQLLDLADNKIVSQIRVNANTLSLTQSNVNIILNELIAYIGANPLDTVPCISEIALIDYGKPQYYFKISNGNVSTTFKANINSIYVCQ